MLLLLLAAMLLAGAWYAYREAFSAPAAGRDRLPSLTASRYDPYRQEISALVEALQNRPCEFVCIRSQDGLNLSGRYYHVRDGAPVDIGFHGYHSSCLTDFSGGAGLSLELGHNLLLVDQRGHGKSEGHTITFGILERQDVVCWTNYVRSRFGPETKILLYGVSMGAASVLMAADQALPDNVRGIIADCPYDSPMHIILSVAKKRKLPVPVVRPLVWLGARIFGGFCLTQTDGVKAVRSTPVPILILHGQQDHLVSWTMSRRIAQANPKMVTCRFFPDADHGLSYLADTETYRKTVTAFLETVLQPHHREE